MKHTIIDASTLGELYDNVVAIKRVTKVVKGGRNMRFSALIVVGDRNGHVGAGVGKAAEIPEAIRKAKEDAIKKLVEVPINENGSIPYGFTGEFGSAKVLLKSAPEGTGIIAGGPARSVLDLAGYKNIRTKSLGSNNKQNVVLATLAGLSSIQLRSLRREARLLPRFLIRRREEMADTIKVTLVKSPIGAIPKHRRTVEALGLTKMHRTVELPNNAATKGMIAQVSYLVKVEE